MATERLERFRMAYLDYLDGEREGPPLLELLDEPDRQSAERWLQSLEDCRGIDPYSQPPSVADIMARLFKSR